MVSLTVLLSVIVAGMNMINYRKVVSDADTRLAVLEENSARIMLEDRLNPFSDFEDYYFENLTMEEISENNQVSKNAVSKTIIEVKEKLNEYESILHLVDNKSKIESVLSLDEIEKIKDYI